MHIQSKFDGGKQINRSQRGSFDSRSIGAGMRVNMGLEWGPICWEKVTKSTIASNETFRTVSANKQKILSQNNKHKATEEVKLQRKRRRLNHDSQQGLDYS